MSWYKGIRRSLEYNKLISKWVLNGPVPARKLSLYSLRKLNEKCVENISVGLGTNHNNLSGIMLITPDHFRPSVWSKMVSRSL